MELRSGSPTVEVPSAAADRPSWIKVGAMAAVGFAVGVAWPRVAGVRLGPSVPDSPSSSVASREPSIPSAPPSAGPSEPSAVVAAPPASVSAPLPPMTAVTPSHGSVFACKTDSGESLKAGECGSLAGLDGVLLPRLRKLADCPAAAGIAGTLRLVAHVDFEHGVSVDLGRNHGGMPSAEPLLACAKVDVAGANVAHVSHEHPRYSVAYTVAFAQEGPAGAASNTAPASTNGSSAPPSARQDGLRTEKESVPAREGTVTPEAVAKAPPRDGSRDAETATVEWDAAIVRDEPKSGKIVARLPRGTALRLGPVKDGWYPVKYGDGFANEGWVYRGAIGR
jgi:hypothetical protein